MARGRLIAWPAYVDLFGGLLVVTLAAIMITAKDRNRLRQLQEEREPQTLAQMQALKLLNSLQETLDIPGVKGHRCSDEDVCLDIDLTFERNSDVLGLSDRSRLAQVALALKMAVDRDSKWRPYAQIVVEGHTDDTQALTYRDEREKYKYNWDLSARRASAVLFELSKSGLGRPSYNIVAWGRADSDPRCDRQPASEDCRTQNRRTTLKVRFDYYQAHRTGGAKSSDGDH